MPRADPGPPAPHYKPNKTMMENAERKGDHFIVETDTMWEVYAEGAHGRPEPNPIATFLHRPDAIAFIVKRSNEKTPLNEASDAMVIGEAIKRFVRRNYISLQD